MNDTQDNALLALAGICDAIVVLVRASGRIGVPGGRIYAALMAHGCTLEQYEQIMGWLVGAGLVRKQGECYHATGVK